MTCSFASLPLERLPSRKRLHGSNLQFFLRLNVRLVLDLSCRRRPGGLERGDFLVVTNKWQKFTCFAVTRENLERLADYCDEFLVHGVDAEVLITQVAALDRWYCSCSR